MQADGSQWCDWCGDELKVRSNGRLYADGQTEPSKPLLIGDRICGRCDAAVKRKDTVYTAKPNKSLAKYVRDVEAGRITAPYTGRVRLETAFGKTDVSVPVNLKKDGSLRPVDRKLLKTSKS